jgi:hypothetical protein
LKRLHVSFPPSNFRNKFRIKGVTAPHKTIKSISTRHAALASFVFGQLDSLIGSTDTRNKRQRNQTITSPVVSTPLLLGWNKIDCISHFYDGAGHYKLGQNDERLMIHLCAITYSVKDIKLALVGPRQKFNLMAPKRVIHVIFQEASCNFGEEVNDNRMSWWYVHSNRVDQRFVLSL